MSTSEISYYFRKLRQKYILLRLSEILLWSISSASLVYGLTTLIDITAYLNYILPAAAWILIFISGILRFKLHKLDKTRFISFINERYPQLEESTDLLIKENSELSSLGQLQRQRTIDKFNQLYPSIRFPHQLGRAALTFSVCIVIAFVLISFRTRSETRSIEKRSGNVQVVNTKKIKLPASIKALVITVTPSPYTRIKSYRSENPHLNLPEGSIVHWNIQFTDTIRQVAAVFSGRDTLKLIRRKNYYVLNRPIKEPGFYQLLWKSNSGQIKTSDFYKIEVIYDRAPETKISNLKQSTELTINDKLTIDLKATISDDYSIQDAWIIATVSKGSGESVKFREEKLQFTSPVQMQGKQINALRTLDLMKLGLEPGDELYFYAEAYDNHQPLANRSRTETYFITLQDTASENLSVDAGLGVDLMPEYFRSQRQIIIDTEKLLKQRKQLTKQAFNFTSNELGYDQKVLRLKYGEFLGEEFESEIVETEDPVEDVPEEQTDEDAEVTGKFGHAHDKDNEHNLVEEKKQGTKHVHDGDEDPEKEKDPLESFKHVHDNLEEATFFTQSIRAKLKAALTVMWDAELHLRLFDPEKSLPYQYRALKLLKEISNDSRIYVHKTGFDPPPIKEDKRLAGDLAEIKSTLYESQLSDPAGSPGIIHALTVTENLLHQEKVILSTTDKEVFQLAAKELSILALEYPGRFLTTLSQIKALNEGEIQEDKTKETLIKIRRSLWNALPQKTISPSQQRQANHQLDQLFIKNLEALKNE